MASLRKRACLVSVVLCLTTTLLTTPGCETVEALLQTMPKPTAELDSLSLGNISLQDATIDIAVKVNNPYSVSIPNLSLDYNLKTQGIDFVSGKMTSNQAIPAKQSAIVNIPVKVSFASLLKLSQSVRPGQVIGYDANVKVSTNVPGVGPISLPLRKKGELPIPRIPKISVAKVDWGKLSLTNTTATIHLNVTNLNDFNFAMKQLSYNFAIGGKSVVSSKITDALQFNKDQTQTLKIPVSFRATSLGFGMLNMIRNKKASYSMTGQLDADTPFGDITFPFASE